MNPDELEHLIDRELKQLPVPRAPETLLPRVLAATAARRPAPSRPTLWFEWPRRWQVAAVAVLALITAGAAALGCVWWPEMTAALASLGGAAGTVARVADAAQDGATLVRACWRVLLGPVTFSLLVVALSLSLACAALWRALDRATLGGV